MAESAKITRVKLCLDGDLVDEHALLEIRLADLTEAGEKADVIDALADEVIALEQRIAEAETEYVFRGLGRGRWRKLKADHPPTDEQKASINAEFDIDVFPFVAMAACIESPTMTADDFRKLNDTVLDEVQWSLLWGTCYAANVGAVNRPESEAARSALENARRRSEQRSDSGSAAAS